MVFAVVTAFAGAGEPGPASPLPAENLVTPARSTSAAPQAQLAQLQRLGVLSWQHAGYRGQGVKVAVLDSGFRGYEKFLGNALPAHVTARSFRADGDLQAKNSQHGILCAEVVHTLAPDAQILLANWDPHQPDEFVQAVRWAKEQGAQVISCSLIMPSWSDGDGGGALHDQLKEILGDGSHTGDLLFFASAGNTAQRHWSGPFHDAGDGYHAWQPGRTDDLLTPWGNDEVSVELYAHTGSNYELTVSDHETGEAIGTSRTRAERCSAVVHFMPTSGHTYQVRVRLCEGEGGRFHLVALGAGLDCATSEGSVAFPADGAEIVAVGAVSAAGDRLAYSSCGGEGGCLKPDLVAPVPFPSSWRSKPFSGTSAAAPEAAGLAALCWSRHSEATAREIRAVLQHSARDLGPPGYDRETGYGMIRLPELPSGASARRSH